MIIIINDNKSINDNTYANFKILIIYYISNFYISKLNFFHIKKITYGYSFMMHLSNFRIFEISNFFF